MHLNGQNAALDLIDWENYRLQNHCHRSRWRWTVSVMMHTIVVCLWYNFLALVIAVQHLLVYAMNVQFVNCVQCSHIPHLIASMIVFAHFHAVPALDAQALVIVHAAAVAWVVYDCSVWPFWMLVCLSFGMKRKTRRRRRKNNENQSKYYDSNRISKVHLAMIQYLQFNLILDR